MSQLQETHLNRARASLRQAISWYGYLRKSGQLSSKAELAGLVKPEIEVLTTTLSKLDSNVVRIAAFGLVSRGKSAVLNSLLGEKILQTGPLNGVTQWTRALNWKPGGKVIVELSDPLGLDEMEGKTRVQMARDVA
ncbi:MAG: dynamin family protein, partial [Sphaerospermopsis kisseleviana]